MSDQMEFDFRPPPAVVVSLTVYDSGDVRSAQRRSLIQRRVLRSLVDGPRSADELAAELDEEILMVRPRLSELKNAGLVVKTSEWGVRLTDLNQRSKRYAITALGMTELALRERVAS